MPSIKRGLSSSLNSSCEDLGVSDLEESSPAKRISINAHMSSFASILSPPSPLPVVISALGENEKVFLNFDFKLRLAFLKALESIVGPVVKAYIKPGGDYFIHPHNQKQKEQLLKLTVIGEIHIKCSKTRGETEFKGVIFNVPINEDSDYVRELLESQHVINVRRFTKRQPDESFILTKTLELTFSRPLPPSVSLVGHIYPVTRAIRSPPQCTLNCHRIGHTTRNCQYEARCKSCGEPPHADAVCPNSARCINCSLTSHVTGSPLCPLFIENKEINKLASELSISFPEAKQRFALSKTPTVKPPIPSSSLIPPSSELEELRMKFALLETKVDMIDKTIEPLCSLEA